jgi:hypothetical protein
MKLSVPAVICPQAELASNYAVWGLQSNAWLKRNPLLWRCVEWKCEGSSKTSKMMTLSNIEI